MTTLISDTKRFLTFLHLLLVKYVANGFKITRYSSGAWNKGYDNMLIIKCSNDTLQLS